MFVAVGERGAANNFVAQRSRLKKCHRVVFSIMTVGYAPPPGKFRSTMALQGKRRSLELKKANFTGTESSIM